MVEAIYAAQVVDLEAHTDVAADPSCARGDYTIWFSRRSGISEYWVMKGNEMCMPTSVPFTDYLSANLWLNKLINEETGQQIYAHADVSDYSEL